MILIWQTLFLAIVATTAVVAKDRKRNDVLDKLWKHDGTLDDVWQAYKETHKKKYSLKEELFRRQIWEFNAEKVQRHNLEYDLGKHTYTLGINEYADLTWDEYKKFLLGARPPPPGTRSNASEGFNLTKVKGLSDTVDWREKGYVTPIKNQGQCGSCWAFSTTGSLEGAHFKKNGTLTSLSEQNLVDCTIKYGNAGCNGGWMDSAFKYVEDNGGIDLEQAYPYEAQDDTCRYMDYYKGSTLTKFVDVKPRQSEDALKAAVSSIGPVSVAIDAAHQSFQLYRSGVYFEDSCSTTQSDHAVLVVGYGTTSDNYPYWLVKNSWGTSWGMDGFIMMARGYDNMCAIATYASYPVV